MLTLDDPGDFPEGRIDSGDNMLQIAHTIPQAVTKGEMTIDEGIRQINHPLSTA
jgi:hypothetical protein